MTCFWSTVLCHLESSLPNSLQFVSVAPRIGHLDLNTTFEVWCDQINQEKDDPLLRYSSIGASYDCTYFPITKLNHSPTLWGLSHICSTSSHPISMHLVRGPKGRTIHTLTAIKFHPRSGEPNLSNPIWMLSTNPISQSSIFASKLLGNMLNRTQPIAVHSGPSWLAVHPLHNYFQIHLSSSADCSLVYKTVIWRLT